MFIACALTNHVLRSELLYSKGAKTNEYTGGQIFFNPYINSLDYGIRLSGDLGPNMKRLTDEVYQAMLPSPRSSKFLTNLYQAEAPPSEFRDQVIIPFLNVYFYPYTAAQVRQQLFDLPNWEYYYVIFSVVPDSVLLKASWEIIQKHPLFAIEYTARNLWYFLYQPGYFHTRFNPVPMFHGGIFFPLDGQIAIGGGAFGANAAILGLPARATGELAFDTYGLQPDWMRRLYAGIRFTWLASYDAIMRGMFVFMVAAWSVLILHLSSVWSQSVRMRKWVEFIGADQLSAYVLYISVFIFYNAIITAAFTDPDYRYGDMVLLIKLLLAGIGCIAVGRFARGLLRPLLPSLRKGHDCTLASPIDLHEGRVLGTSLIVAIAISAAWAWYMIAHT